MTEEVLGVDELTDKATKEFEMIEEKDERYKLFPEFLKTSKEFKMLKDELIGAMPKGDEEQRIPLLPDDVDHVLTFLQMSLIEKERDIEAIKRLIQERLRDNNISRTKKTAFGIQKFDAGLKACDEHPEPNGPPQSAGHNGAFGLSDKKFYGFNSPHIPNIPCDEGLGFLRGSEAAPMCLRSSDELLRGNDNED